MRAFLAALALVAALIPSTAAQACAPRVQVAQMARDVTDAVRKQRNERQRPQADERTTRGARR